MTTGPLRLLADQVVQLGFADSFSHETGVSAVKNTLKPWQVQEGAFLRSALNLLRRWRICLICTQNPTIQHLVICFDESPKQLIGEVREPIPPQPGAPARQDTEYSATACAI